MGKLGRVALVALLYGACRARQVDDEPSEAPIARSTARGGAPAETADPRFDASGRLKPSKQTLAWLEIPMGFEPDPKAPPRHHIYFGRGISLDQLRDYLGARMLTGTVEEGTRGVIYRAVLPLSSPGDAMRFDVRVLLHPADDMVELDMEQLGYGPQKPLSVEQARKTLAQEQKRAQ